MQNKGRGARRILSVAAAFVAAFCVTGAWAQNWQAMERRGDDSWKKAERSTLELRNGVVTFERKAIGQACATAEFDADLGKTPWVEIEIVPANIHWRLTAEAQGAGERVAADHQMAGTCRRDLATLLGVSGPARVRLRLVTWGWSGSDQQTLIVKSVRFVKDGPRADATEMGGVMKERHARTMAEAKTIHAVDHAHPSLRYRASEKAAWREKARTTHKIFVAPILKRIDDLATLKQSGPILLTPELIKKGSHDWRGKLVALRPPEAPQLAPGQGWSPFRMKGVRIESTWRQMYWHFISNIYIATALDDDPVWTDQMRRWALAMARWRFWMRPSYKFFDFEASYPLQCMSLAYDAGYGAMTDAERAEVRDAIAYIAEALYLNAQTGHGSIYNDLRGNHTAVGMTGLGVAGLALLGEDPNAALWVAKAEEMMLAAFAEHKSGAWYESPSYGAYGVSEWVRLGEELRNVTGRDRLKDPFLKRFGDFQIMISDWDGRDLGYNQGGGGQYWNHWVFLKIAAEFRDPEIQWLGNCALKDVDEAAGYVGYGDAFWWADPSLEEKHPDTKNVGKAFSDVGISVWRSGWSDDATILLLQCGAKGQHKEENMNQFTLYASGARFLPDELGRRANNHNVPLIGKGQHLYSAGKTLRFFSDERAGYALGDAHGAYRTRKGLRHILYLRAGAMVVVDDIELRKPGEIALQLHPNGTTRRAGSGIVVDSGEARLAAVFCDASGKASAPEITPFKGRGKRATHDVRAPFALRGDTKLFTFLRFGPQGEVAATGATATPGKGYLEFRTGDEVWRLGLGPAQMGAEVSTDSAPWFACVKNGKVTSAMAVAKGDGAPVSIHTPSGDVKGAGVVSWSAE